MLFTALFPSALRDRHFIAGSPTTHYSFDSEASLLTVPLPAPLASPKIIYLSVGPSLAHPVCGETPSLVADRSVRGLLIKELQEPTFILDRQLLPVQCSHAIHKLLQVSPASQFVRMGCIKSKPEKEPLSTTTDAPAEAPAETPAAEAPAAETKVEPAATEEAAPPAAAAAT